MVAAQMRIQDNPVQWRAIIFGMITLCLAATVRMLPAHRNAAHSHQTVMIR